MAADPIRIESQGGKLVASAKLDAALRRLLHDAPQPVIAQLLLHVLSAKIKALYQRQLAVPATRIEYNKLARQLKTLRDLQDDNGALEAIGFTKEAARAAGHLEFLLGPCTRERLPARKAVDASIRINLWLIYAILAAEGLPTTTSTWRCADEDEEEERIVGAPLLLRAAYVMHVLLGERKTIAALQRAAAREGLSKPQVLLQTVTPDEQNTAQARHMASHLQLINAAASLTRPGMSTRIEYVDETDGAYTVIATMRPAAP